MTRLSEALAVASCRVQDDPGGLSVPSAPRCRARSRLALLANPALSQIGQIDLRVAIDPRAQIDPADQIAPHLSAGGLRARCVTPGAAGCGPDSTRLCLSAGRFSVTATWRDFSGNTGTGMVVPVSADTGYFWFFSAANVEVMLKVLDGRPVNGKFWVFYGGLSNVAYTITVTDTQTGAVRAYTNADGNLASVADTGAF